MLETRHLDGASLRYVAAMGNFAIDTMPLRTGDGQFTATLSRDWEIWGPNGGYIAALALRAIGATCQRPRPANATVHFLSVATFDEPVSIAVTILRSTRVATSCQATMTQGGRPILHVMAWAVEDGLAGIEHDDAPPPTVDPWHGLPTIEERFEMSGTPYVANYPFWLNLEERPTSWISDWANRLLTRPQFNEWFRFRDVGVDVGVDDGAAPAEDPWLFAARLLLLVDLGGWPAACRAHLDPGVAPTLDVSCEFHRPADSSPWMLLEGTSPHASGGLVASHQRVWNDRGELLASGISHLLCRPLAR